MPKNRHPHRFRRKGRTPRRRPAQAIPRAAGPPVLRRTVAAFAGHPGQHDPGRDRGRTTTRPMRRCDRRAGAATAGHAAGPRRQEFGPQRAGGAGGRCRPDYVLIHDAARPLVTGGADRPRVAALEAGADAAIPMLAGRRYAAPAERGWQLVDRARATTPSAPRRRRASASQADPGGPSRLCGRSGHRRHGAGRTRRPRPSCVSRARKPI